MNKQDVVTFGMVSQYAHDSQRAGWEFSNQVVKRVSCLVEARECRIAKEGPTLPEDGSYCIK
jgi:hypothetical protein